MSRGMIRDNIRETACTDKPPLTFPKVFPPKPPGYSPCSPARKKGSRAGRDPVIRQVRAMFVHNGLMPDYRKCFKPDCMRKVTPASRFCCGSCSTAAEAPAPYEIEPYDPGLHPILCHGRSCDERAAERGEYTALEAAALGQL